jgi:threonine dehydrogenase-like Zn-dependent dehydrogenase
VTEPDRPEYSFARSALASLGAAALVLLLATVLVLALKPGPAVGLVVVLIGVAGAIGAMATVSRRMLRRSFGGDPSDPPA